MDCAVPVSTQFRAFVDDHVTVNRWPLVTVAGFTKIEAVGAGGGATVRVIGDDRSEREERLTGEIAGDGR
jgi:hypothetical protein